MINLRKMQEIRPSITELSFNEGLSLIRKSRQNRFKSKLASKPKAFQKKVKTQKQLKAIFEAMSPEELREFLEQIEQEEKR